MWIPGPGDLLQLGSQSHYFAGEANPAPACCLMEQLGRETHKESFGDLLPHNSWVRANREGHRAF